MDKAQEAKRKWNLEGNAGNKKSSSIFVGNLLDVAKDIGIVVKDGNLGVVEQMLETDSSRCRNRELQCLHKDCNVNPGSGLGAEFKVGNDVQASSSDQQHTRNGDVNKDDLEKNHGWSVVDNRKKNKKKKK